MKPKTKELLCQAAVSLLTLAESIGYKIGLEVFFKFNSEDENYLAAYDELAMIYYNLPIKLKLGKKESAYFWENMARSLREMLTFNV